MEEWIKYASQLNYTRITIELKDREAGYEVKENTFISKSIFEDIRDKGAIYFSDSSSSLIVDLSIFIKCKNSDKGAAIHAILKGSSSLSLTKSCIDNCLNTGTHGSSFCVDGETGSHVVLIEHSTVTNCHGKINDGISLWKTKSLISYLNMSSCSVASNYAGISSNSGNLCNQQFSMYTDLNSTNIFNFGNKCDLIFRCIFKDNNPKAAFARIFYESTFSAVSCVFEECGNNYFEIDDSASAKCFDCFFDQPISNQDSLLIFSKNAKFENYFTYRSLEKCTYHKQKSIKYNKRKFIYKMISTILTLWNF